MSEVMAMVVHAMMEYTFSRNNLMNHSFGTENTNIFLGSEEMGFIDLLSSNGYCFNIQFKRITGKGMIPPITYITGKVVIDKFGITRIGKIHFKLEGPGIVIIRG